MHAKHEKCHSKAQMQGEKQNEEKANLVATVLADLGPVLLIGNV